MTGGDLLWGGGFLCGMAALVLHDDRKLFANGFLLDVAPLVLLTGRKLFANGFPLGMGRMGITYKSILYKNPENAKSVK